MKGFEDRWTDFPDYIIGITRDIWEGRGVARLHDWYAEDLIFRMASGLGVGRQAVIEGTLATMHEFPDRQLLAEDVIWSGSPEDGMLSSHRLYCTGHYRGDGQFGPAKGQPVAFRAIADCHARENRIDDEWLARDQGAICRRWRQPWSARRDPLVLARTAQRGRALWPAQRRRGLYHGLCACVLRPLGAARGNGGL